MNHKAVKLRYIQLLEEKLNRWKYNKLSTYYPDTGKLRREVYPKHTQFFAEGAKYRERAVMAANRIGKTEGIGGYEVAVHLTGLYPEWWVGKKFDHPTSCWACGSTGQTVRDILQRKLLGPISSFGIGLLPKSTIASTKRAPGTVPDKIERVSIYHFNQGLNKIDGISELTFKSYDQKRKAFEGTEQDVILLDEEPNMGIYSECVVRTMTTGGLIMLTFTPLEGLSEVVLSYMPSGRVPDPSTLTPGLSKYLVQASWDDAPHLTEQDKASILAAIPEYQRDARSKGVPQLGSGVIFAMAEDLVKVKDFAIPKHWPRVYGLDVGWNWTAAVWGALDRDNDIVYIYAGYKRGKAEPAVHKECILAKGSWIPGVIDPGANASSQKDGTRLLTEYRAQGLKLTKAINAVEAGLYTCWERLSTSRLRVFASQQEWFEEYRLYRRDDKGNVVKFNDHLMDATRYLLTTGLSLATTEPSQGQQFAVPGSSSHASSWMDR